VIAAFITFMGANTSGEQIRKAVFRVAGTVAGIGAGSLLATAIGHHTYWSITVILAALFLGIYLLRINYAFMAIAITVLVSQLYVQLNEFSNALLLLTDGAGVGFAALTLIDPRGRQAAHAVAGADGAYWLDAPAARTYALLASAGSHRPAASTVIVRETANGSGTVVNVVLADTSGLATST
jgi:uncharacterized membrane protein YccC